MIPSGSRYQQAASEKTICHVYDAFNRPLLFKEDEVYRYRVETRETTYLVSTLPLPPPPPREYYAKDGESMQFLAYKFLKDPTLWWQISEANPSVWYPLDLQPGEYLRVPG